MDTLAKFILVKEKARVYYALFSGSGFDPKVVEAAAGSDRLILYIVNNT